MFLRVSMGPTKGTTTSALKSHKSHLLPTAQTPIRLTPADLRRRRLNNRPLRSRRCSRRTEINFSDRFNLRSRYNKFLHRYFSHRSMIFLHLKVTVTLWTKSIRRRRTKKSATVWTENRIRRREACSIVKLVAFRTHDFLLIWKNWTATIELKKKKV